LVVIFHASIDVYCIVVERESYVSITLCVTLLRIYIYSYSPMCLVLVQSMLATLVDSKSPPPILYVDMHRVYIIIYHLSNHLYSIIPFQFQQSTHYNHQLIPSHPIPSHSIHPSVKSRREEKKHDIYLTPLHLISLLSSPMLPSPFLSYALLCSVSEYSCTQISNITIHHLKNHI